MNGYKLYKGFQYALILQIVTVISGIALFLGGYMPFNLYTTLIWLCAISYFIYFAWDVSRKPEKFIEYIDDHRLKTGLVFVFLFTLVSNGFFVFNSSHRAVLNQNDEIVVEQHKTELEAPRPSLAEQEKARKAAIHKRRNEDHNDSIQNSLEESNKQFDNMMLGGL